MVENDKDSQLCCIFPIALEPLSAFELWKPIYASALLAGQHIALSALLVLIGHSNKNDNVILAARMSGQSWPASPLYSGRQCSLISLAAANIVFYM